jgi:hypothetical protein
MTSSISVTDFASVPTTCGYVPPTTCGLQSNADVASDYSYQPGQCFMSDFLTHLAKEANDSTNGPPYTISLANGNNPGHPSSVHSLDPPEDQQTVETVASSDTPSNVDAAQRLTPGGGENQRHGKDEQAKGPPEATAVAVQRSSEYGTWWMAVVPPAGFPCQLEWLRISGRPSGSKDLREEAARIAQRIAPNMVKDPRQIDTVWLVGANVPHAFEGLREAFEGIKFIAGSPCSASEGSESEESGRLGRALMKLGRQIGW